MKINEFIKSNSCNAKLSTILVFCFLFSSDLLKNELFLNFGYVHTEFFLVSMIKPMIELVINNYSLKCVEIHYYLMTKLYINLFPF